MLIHHRLFKKYHAYLKVYMVYPQAFRGYFLNRLRSPLNRFQKWSLLRIGLWNLRVLLMYVHVVLHNVAFGLSAVLTWCAIFCSFDQGWRERWRAQRIQRSKPQIGGTPLRRGAMICHDVPQSLLRCWHQLDSWTILSWAGPWYLVSILCPTLFILAAVADW